MKTPLLAVLTLGISLTSAFAQFGGPNIGAGPLSKGFDKTFAKLFGDNKAFTANMEVQVDSKGQGQMSIPGKLAFNDGKSRFEMDMANMKGGNIPPEAVEQMKAMGMSSMVVITRPEQKETLMIYPGMQSYVRNPIPDESSSAKEPTIQVTELGRESVGGHQAIKNKVVVEGTDGKKQELTVWNATDLKKFPVKMQFTEKDTTVNLSFNDVKLTAPPSSQFDPPASYKKYDNMQVMMQEVMMKQFGGGAPGAAPKKN